LISARIVSLVSTSTVVAPTAAGRARRKKVLQGPSGVIRPDAGHRDAEQGELMIRTMLTQSRA
jgi:hypothetical protein